MPIKSKSSKSKISNKTDSSPETRKKSKERLVRCKVPKYEDWTAPQIAILKPRVFYRYLDRRARRSSKALRQMRITRKCLHHIKPPLTAPEDAGFWVSVDASFNMVDFNIGKKTEVRKHGHLQSYWTSHLCWTLIASSSRKAARHIVTKFCDVYFDGRKDQDILNSFVLTKDNFDLGCKRMHTPFSNGHEDWLVSQM